MARTKEPTVKPSPAFLIGSWIALAVGVVAYLLGLWNATIQLNEKGYYFIALMYGLFAAVSLQNAVKHGVINSKPQGSRRRQSWTAERRVIHGGRGG